ncbi:MAG: hypothetical protein CME65_04150 [Halobacteriovoraceae bacterium]|nr:hypothetical protein [Halobacteriovoraceae bacterium]|tara:strand:- start:20199 stop:20408 length:210 start_codon:yes stop_codon:yes gene_type:complete
MLLKLFKDMESFEILPNNSSDIDIIEFIEELNNNTDLYSLNELEQIQLEIGKYIDLKLKVFGSNVKSLF